ncbi:MAG: hypothetical protein KDK34_02560 [Leptospiraceae bacterium]|nr:hypothetical protein [Leptospiraceae bacterium]
MSNEPKFKVVVGYTGFVSFGRPFTGSAEFFSNGWPKPTESIRAAFIQEGILDRAGNPTDKAEQFKNPQRAFLEITSVDILPAGTLTESSEPAAQEMLKTPDKPNTPKPGNDDQKT